MFEAESKADGGNAENDTIIRVLDNLIGQHGGKEAADSAVAQHHAMEANGACINVKGNFAYSYSGPVMSSGGGAAMSMEAGSTEL
jgi:hypothetical protein